MNSKKHFSVGEIAKLTGVSIRTLQYYDNIGLVSLNKESTNGRRFYEEADLTKLQQVLFYKSLGLPIKEIKLLLVEAVTNKEIVSVLRRQREVMQQQLISMKMNISLIDTSLENLEKSNSSLSGEFIELMISLNKDVIYEYKDVHYDINTENIFKKNYESTEDVVQFYLNWKTLILEAVTHILNGVNPKEKQGQDLGRKWLDLISQITNGNLELIEAHKVAYENRDKWPEEDRRLMEFANEFIDMAVEAYLASNN